MITQQESVSVSGEDGKAIPDSIWNSKKRLFSFKLKMQDYKTDKLIIIPFNREQSNEGRFLTLNDAMQYIHDHCIKYHGIFKRVLAKKYAQFAFIPDLGLGVYIPISSIDKKLFNASYRVVSHRYINTL